MFKPIFTEGVWDTTFSSDLKDYCDFVKEHNKGVQFQIRVVIKVTTYL